MLPFCGAVKVVDKLGHPNKAGNIPDYMNRQCGNPYTIVGTWKFLYHYYSVVQEHWCY